MSSTSVVRAVRTLSEVHRTSMALLRRDMTVHQFLETKVFSPENFPTFLKLGISFSFLDFCGVLGCRYMQKKGSMAATSAAAKATTKAAVGSSSSSAVVNSVNGATTTTKAAAVTTMSGASVYRYFGE